MHLPAGAQPFIRVRVEDGTEYCGMLASYTADSEMADRELVPAPPLTRQRPKDARPSPLAEPWQRVVVPGSAIQDLWVAYPTSRSSSGKADEALDVAEPAQGQEGREVVEGNSGSSPAGSR
jgi:Family of unknown function (DUF6338)